MKDILNTLKIALSEGLIKVLMQICTTIQKFFEWREHSNTIKEEKEHKKEIQDYNKKVDKVVDKGTIEDLLDLRREK